MLLCPAADDSAARSTVALTSLPASGDYWPLRLSLSLPADPPLCRERNIPEIQSMYEISFPKLSERYFKNGPWPAAELVADLVDQDHVFCLLYKVLAAQWQPACS